MNTSKKPAFDVDSLFSTVRELEPDREDYVRAPFGWPGGKSRSLKYIIPEIQKVKDRHTFVDGCGGSGAIILNVASSFKLNVFNDKHTGVVAFYRCLRDSEKVEKLMERLECSLHSREEFIWSKETWENCQDDVERAARWYYTIRMSFAQLGRNFGRSTNSLPQQGGAYFNSIPEFHSIHKIFKNIQVENMDVVRLIRDYDSSNSVFYVDPDYIGTNPCYKHTVHHKNLLETIKSSKGCFFLSGYSNELYDSYSWDDKKSWDVHVSITSQAFSEGSYLEDKKHVMGREIKAKETLWIREAR